MAVLNDLAHTNCSLKSIENFSDATIYDPEMGLQSGTLGDLIASEADGVVWAEETFCYEEETL